MKRIHIGHHFFGSGNLGDDFVLSAFLEALIDTKVSFSCCVPYNIEPLRLRYPQIDWMPYTYEYRQNAIKNCDIWLGLGGSPFQSSVSPWFIKHLSEETALCSALKKKLYFLGIGGQDLEAYTNQDLIDIMSQSEGIWTRDMTTFEALQKQKVNVRLGADLSHLLFDIYSPAKAVPGRLTTALNFDYKNWPILAETIDTLELLKPNERVWMVQESREIPGAEKELFKLLSTKQQSLWRPLSCDQPTQSMKEVIHRWPSGEWLLSSRYHSTLASAWSGSKTVVLETNLKLKSAALECGYKSLSVTSDPKEIINSLSNARLPNSNLLKTQAALARTSIKEFCTLSDIT